MRLIEVDGTNYSNISLGVDGEPVFVLERHGEGGSVVLATLSYLQDHGHYVQEGDETWFELADAIYIRRTDKPGLHEVWLETKDGSDGKSVTHVYLRATGVPVCSWES